MVELSDFTFKVGGIIKQAGGTKFGVGWLSGVYIVKAQRGGETVISSACEELAVILPAPAAVPHPVNHKDGVVHGIRTVVFIIVTPRVIIQGKRRKYVSTGLSRMGISLGKGRPSEGTIFEAYRLPGDNRL
jgi:hypothetical protein